MTLRKPANFFDVLRGGMLGSTLDLSEVAGLNAVIKGCLGLPLAWTAYALATAYHETAHTMQPIKERGGDVYLARMYDITGPRPDKARLLGNTSPGDGVRYAGRGYVQLTGKNNYLKASGWVGEDLVERPDLAMQPDIAADILRLGMCGGWFTARKFSDYLPSVGEATMGQFTAARRIINGTDRAADVAAYAMDFQAALVRGEWA